MLQGFVRNKPPPELTVEDVKSFLTFLAVQRRVSASSQNQAFDALLVVFRHALGKKFGEVEGVVRPKKRPYVRVVLSRKEVKQLVERLAPRVEMTRGPYLPFQARGLPTRALCLRRP